MGRYIDISVSLLDWPVVVSKLAEHYLLYTERESSSLGYTYMEILILFGLHSRPNLFIIIRIIIMPNVADVTE